MSDKIKLPTDGARAVRRREAREMQTDGPESLSHYAPGGGSGIHFVWVYTQTRNASGRPVTREEAAGYLASHPAAAHLRDSGFRLTEVGGVPVAYQPVARLSPDTLKVPLPGHLGEAVEVRVARSASRGSLASPRTKAEASFRTRSGATR